MDVKNLAEAVILQSLEDLFNAEHSRESMKFFMGHGFSLAADLAGLDETGRKKIRAMIISAVSAGRRRKKSEKELKESESMPRLKLRRMDMIQGGLQCMG